MLYTLFDFQNWFGPKAMWLDFCDFHTSEDFLIFAQNPGGIQKDTGDKTFLKQKLNYNFDGTPATTTPFEV